MAKVQELETDQLLLGVESNEVLNTRVKEESGWNWVRLMVCSISISIHMQLDATVLTHAEMIAVSRITDFEPLMQKLPH